MNPDTHVVQQDAVESNIQDFELFLKNLPVRPLRIVSFANYDAIQQIKEKLIVDQLDMFRQPCFGMYLDIPECTFQVQMHRCLMTLEVEQENSDEFWISVNGSILRFTISEFALITGLKCTDNEEDF